MPIPLRESRGFSLDLNELRDPITDRTKLMILNSPQNPTGGIIPADDIKQIADILRDRDIMVLSDEIYSRISYDIRRATRARPLRSPAWTACWRRPSSWMDSRRLIR